MTEEVLDIRRILRMLLRRWPLLVAVLVAGAAAGLGTAVVQSPTYVAKSLVLLPPSAVDSVGNPLRNIQTEVSVGGSAEILSRAGQTFRPALSAESLRRRVKVAALTPDILEFRAKAGTGRDAATVANSVASAYVGFTNDATAEVATTTLADLQAQAGDLDKHLRQVNADIATSTAQLAGLGPQSPEALRQGVIIDSLRQDLSDTARQLSTVNNKIADARLNSDLARRGTRLLQPALVPGTPAQPRPLRLAALGGVGGLLIAIIALLIVGRDRRRLRRRGDIASAVAAPVLGSLAVPRRDGVEDYKDLVQHWRPSLAERWSMRQPLSQLADQPTDLAIVTLAGDVAGPALALMVAKLAAGSGTSTALVVDTPHPDATPLRAACTMGPGRGAAITGQLSLHTSAPEGEGQDLFPGHQLTVTLVVADGKAMRFPTRGRRTVTWLAVSSGFATADQLAAAAVRSFDGGHPISAVLVANPEPTDPTTGRTTPPPLPVVEYVDAPEESNNGAANIPRPVS